MLRPLDEIRPYRLEMGTRLGLGFGLVRVRVRVLHLAHRALACGHGPGKAAGQEALQGVARRGEVLEACAAPRWSKAAKSAALEAASSSSTRGSCWPPGGLANPNPWKSTPPRATRPTQSHQALPEEAQEASWGTAEGAL